MTNATASKDISDIFAPSPVMDSSLLSVVDDPKQLERRVDGFEAEVTAWRSSAIARLSQLEINPENLDATDRDAVIRQLNGAIGNVEAGLKSLSQPLHAVPAVAQKVKQLAGVSKAAGKFIRKLLRRIERIRVAQHAVHVDLYYGLLALQSELEGNKAEGERFRDPAKLGASLRSQLA